MRDVKDKDKSCENEDLKFIESLGTKDETRRSEEEKSSEDGGGNNSVVVLDIKEETKDLEDWLDDFLED